MLKYFDENYDEFGPKGLLDIDDHSGHITVGKGLLGVDSISMVLDAQQLDLMETGEGDIDVSAGKVLYEGLALWLMREQLVRAHGESSREEAALRLQDELILAEEREQQRKKAKSNGKKSKQLKVKKDAAILVEEAAAAEAEAVAVEEAEAAAAAAAAAEAEMSYESSEAEEEVEMLGALVESTKLRKNKSNNSLHSAHLNTSDSAPNQATTVYQSVDHPGDPSMLGEERRGTGGQVGAGGQVKVRLCQRFFNTGECARRNECWYAHTLDELEASARRNFKTRPCHAFQFGNCKFGACCTFAHGNVQLRFPDDPVVLPPVPGMIVRAGPGGRNAVGTSAPSRNHIPERCVEVGAAVQLPTPLPKQQPQPLPLPQQQRNLVDELASVRPGGMQTELQLGSGALFANSADPIFRPMSGHTSVGWNRPAAAVGPRLNNSGSNSQLDQMVHQEVHQIGLWDPDEGLCKICLEAQFEVKLMPCGHSSFCAQCVRHQEACPLCRTVIQSITPLV